MGPWLVFFWEIALTGGLIWRGDELCGEEIGHRTGYIICRVQYELKSGDPY